jgi:hypothetical protein
MRSSISARIVHGASVLVLVVALMMSWARTTQAATATPAAAAKASASARAAAAARTSARAPTSARASAAGRSRWRIVALHYGPRQNASGYSAIVAPGRSDTWAFGGTNPGGSSQPAALHWNGTRWRTSPLPKGLSGFIGDASAPSARDIWAVSYSGGYVLHWNGRRWSVAKRWYHNEVLTSVTALGPADVWVFGTTTAGDTGMGTWHFDGRSWVRVRGRGGEIYRASAVSARNIWAVAAARGGGFVERYDGRSWRRVRTLRVLNRASLDDVLALSGHDVWLVGNLRARRGEGRLVVAHFDGRRWTRTFTPWHADTSRVAPDGSGGIWITADTTRIGPHALIGHLSSEGRQTWATLRHGQGSGVSDIAVVRGTTRVWVSGGFLTQAGGDAAIWSHASSRRSGNDDGQAPAIAHARAAAAADLETWLGHRALAYPSWPLD